MAIQSIKILGVIVALGGITLNLFDLLGYFIHEQKYAFAERVMSDTAIIPRTTPGFEIFLRDFPAPDGIPGEQVAGIGDKAARWDTSPTESLAVVYVVNGDRTSPVARLDEVRDWGNATIYGWLSLLVTFTGWLIYASTEILSSLKKDRSAVRSR